MTDLEAMADAAPAADPAELADIERRAGVDERRLYLLRSGAPLSRAERELLAHDRDLEWTPALDQAKRWLARAVHRDSPGASILILSGPEGTGRTFAAAWVIARRSGRYLDVDQFVYAYRQAARKTARQRDRDDVRALRRCQVLVLAGVGSERDHEAMSDALSSVLDARQGARGRLTVLLTELELSPFNDHAAHVYGARTNEELLRGARQVNLRAEYLQRIAGLPPDERDALLRGLW